jgi:crotonobetainyl-CoA:carnitine CoA-transferase CaiB-like acyl-CoA transferase
MGNYTTAPLAARNLAAMGAYVVKVEPPGGELARAAPPQRAGQSYLCTFSNNDKRCVALDLQKEEGRTLFADLLARADVFVDNMKPGVLARFGFGPAQIERLNPRIVYCSVSGFGAGSALGQRPAMDATIQGMAGLMDLTRQADVPYKVGVSVADIVGGQFALLAILAGLEHRARTGTGQTIDISMHEVTAWLTQFVWNDGTAAPRGKVERQGEGYVHVSPARTVPVNTVSAIARHPHTLRRGVLVEGQARDGTPWPLLACPIRMSPWPTVVKRAIGAVGADLDEVLRDWDMTLPATAASASPAACDRD